MKLNVGLIGKGKWGKIVKKKIECSVKFKIYLWQKKNYLKLIKSSNIKWVFIITPNKTHYKLVKMCLDNKVNVFCEKPLCLTISQAKKLIMIAKKNKVKLFVSDLYNFYTNKFKKNKSITEVYRSKFIHGPDNEFFFRFMYHDISILYKHLKKLVNFNCKIYQNNFEKKFQLVIHSPKKNFTFYYDLKSKKKRHSINNLHIRSKKDILKEMINNVLKKRSNYYQNNLKAVFIIKFINKIKKRVRYAN